MKVLLRFVAIQVFLFAVSGLGLAQSDAASIRAGWQEQPAVASRPEGGQLIIDTTSLPSGYTRGTYSFTFHAHGGIPPLHWKVEKGELPPGLRLEDDGTVLGAPEKPGEYRFTVSVTDNGKPLQVVEREFVLNVLRALVLQWKVPPHVAGGRIEGQGRRHASQEFGDARSGDARCAGRLAQAQTCRRVWCRRIRRRTHVAGHLAGARAQCHLRTERRAWFHEQGAGTNFYTNCDRL